MNISNNTSLSTDLVDQRLSQLLTLGGEESFLELFQLVDSRDGAESFLELAFYL